MDLLVLQLNDVNFIFDNFINLWLILLYLHNPMSFISFILCLLLFFDFIFYLIVGMQERCS
jgi:hypothetical protein